MATYCPVQEFRIWENWKCAHMETPKVLKLEDPKWWGTMMSPRGDVDPRIF